MNKIEYNLLKSNLIKQLGEPLWELNKPVNDSALKLVELKNQFLREGREALELKKLVKDVKDVEFNEQTDLVVPDDIVKDSWLSPFNDDQKLVIKCWLSDISQSKQQIAQATSLPVATVRTTFRSDAFKSLRKHLELAFKPLLPLEALATLRTLLRSKTENVALQAAKLVLLDAGLYKGDSIDITQTKTTEVLLDAATEEKLRKLGNDVLGVESE